MAKRNELLFRYLDTVGDGSGTKNAVGDYSSSATKFLIKPPSDETFIIERLIVSVEDGGSFDAAKYGNGITLTNGMHVHEEVNGVQKLDLIDAGGGQTIKTNADWGALCYDADVKTWGTGNQVLLVRWTFSKAGAPVRLDGAIGEELTITLNDDFSALVDHRFMAQGTRRFPFT